MATSRSTTLAWYSAGTPVAAGVAGTNWWPGGAITADTALTTLTTTAGSAVLTRSTGSFTSDMAGRFVKIVGAGAGGVDLETYILTYTSATSVTLAVNAGTAIAGTGSGVVYGEWYQNKAISGDIPQSNMWSKTPLYTNIYLKNVSSGTTYNNIYVGISRASGNQNTSDTIGKSSLAVSVSEAARTNANLGTAPSGVVFSNSVLLTSLTPGQFQSFWIKHTPLVSTLGTSTSLSEAGIVLTLSANYT